MMRGSSKLFIFVYCLLNCTWGIIQNTFASIIFLFLIITKKREVYTFNGAIVTQWDNKFSCGCGLFIFFGHKSAKNADEVLVHEYGHTIQSTILGPLFMFIVGLPSAVWAFMPMFVKQRRQGKYNYYDFYPESWANRLGTKITGSASPLR